MNCFLPDSRSFHTGDMDRRYATTRGTSRRMGRSPTAGSTCAETQPPQGAHGRWPTTAHGWDPASRRGAGGAGGGADACIIQQQQERLALNALEAEVDVAGQPVHRVAVESAVGDLGQPLSLSRRAESPWPGSLEASSSLQRPGGDAGTFRTGSLAPLCAPPSMRLVMGTPCPDIQSTYALGAVELVAGETQSISMCWALTSMGNVPPPVRRRWNSTPAPAYGADLLDGERCCRSCWRTSPLPDSSIRPDSLLHLLGGNGAGGAHRQRHLEALLLQTLQGVEDGVVLKGGGDDVLLALQPSQLRKRTAEPDCRPHAGGEEGSHGACSSGTGPWPSRALCSSSAACWPTVQAGGVSVVVLQRRQHGGQCHRTHLGGSGIICVYHRDSSEKIYLPFGMFSSIAGLTYQVQGV